MSSSFGTIFRITTYGESHCRSVGVVIDGCPGGMGLTEKDIQPQLNRRRPGQNRISTDRKEADQVTILSGTEHGKTLGTPVALMVANKDQRPGDYSSMSEIPRPSHADYTYQMKYGIRASSGGGRSSARETIGRVAAGAVAEKLLQAAAGIEIVAWVNSVGGISAPPFSIMDLTRSEVDRTAIRCPDLKTAQKMEAEVLRIKALSDSIGGTVSCICRNVPPGLGEPVFDKLEARMAQAMLSIPATKGFEIGSGFQGTHSLGSEHNDMFVQKGNRLGTITNNSGGVQGGITNGEPLFFSVAFKPPATIGKKQQTVTFRGEDVTLAAKGRHDPCVVSRAVPIVEGMAALVLADMLLIQRTRGFQWPD